MTIILFVLVFVAGGGCMLAVLLLIERRTLARPGARVAVAKRLLDGGAR